jgi:hypothetical protein
MEMRILNVYELNVFNVLRFIYMWKNDLCPLVFKDLFILKPINKYNLRNNNFVNEPFCKTRFNQFCISYRAPYLWNRIVLPHFDLSTTFPVFKNKLKNFILSIENIFEYF